MLNRNETRVIIMIIYFIFSYHSGFEIMRFKVRWNVECRIGVTLNLILNCKMEI
jgi:hypothetical protein